MEQNPKPDLNAAPMSLGADGETLFDRLKTRLDLGQGFEAYFCGFDAPNVMREVERRLITFGDIEVIEFETASDIANLSDYLIAPPFQRGAPLPQEGRLVIFAYASGWDEELRPSWAEALRRMNERRNSIMQQCPHALILAGPLWLPLVAHDEAPDLWSVRTDIFYFSSPPQVQDNGSIVDNEKWPTGFPMPHELDTPEYYIGLAEALESSRRPEDCETRGKLLLRASVASNLRGDIDKSLMLARKASECFYSVKNMGLWAGSRGYIADILQEQNKTEESLRIWEDEIIPSLNEWGDEFSKAFASGKKADFLQKRGDIDEALRIRLEEELPAYERLGELRSKAITLGSISEILRQRGETDQALRILRDDVLPFFERDGDVRSKAITMGRIADILEQRGQFDEALRIRREDELPVYERLGDVRSKVTTLGKVADILQKRGETDEALRIRCEEELPVYERLGDDLARGIALFKCAQIRMDRAEFKKDEYKLILKELSESFSINKRIKRADGIAAVGMLYGKVLAATGHSDQALNIFAESLAAFDKLGKAEQVQYVRTLIEEIKEKKADA